MSGERDSDADQGTSTGVTATEASLATDAANPSDVRNLLAAAHIAKLRSGYDPRAMSQGATAGLVSPFPPARGFVDFLIGRFYESPRWAPDRREQCLITFFAARSAGNAANLSIHIYWGLMEGLSPDDIAETILLASVYSGIENYSTSIYIMRDALLALKELAESPDPAAVHCASVVKRLRR